MTILEACFSPALGGLELYCLNTAHQLERRGHRVFIWLAEDSRMLRHPLVASMNVQIFPEPFRFDLFFCRKAAKFMQKNAVDVIHLHRSRDLASFSLIKWPPKVLTLQIESRLPKKDPYHCFVYSRMDRLLTITERMKGFALKALPVNPYKVFALHYGIDALSFHANAPDRNASRQAWSLPDDAILIGLVGRLEESKGQDVLLRAFADIYRAFPQTYLLFSGEPPPEKQGYDLTLKALAEDLGIYDRVIFAGFQQDIASVYAALDVCVLASKEEAFGLVLLEAMALGVPIIATAAGGVPEIIMDGVNGLLMPPGDVRALSEALVHLIRGEDLRKNIGANGRRIVQDKFNLHDHLEALETHFSEVIKLKSRTNSVGNR